MPRLRALGTARTSPLQRVPLEESVEAPISMVPHRNACTLHIILRVWLIWHNFRCFIRVLAIFWIIRSQGAKRMSQGSHRSPKQLHTLLFLQPWLWGRGIQNCSLMTRDTLNWSAKFQVTGKESNSSRERRDRAHMVLWRGFN